MTKDLNFMNMLQGAVRAFDARVRHRLVPSPQCSTSRRNARKSCHPLVTTEADFQRWFGAALESECGDNATVHAEVYAFATAARGAARCDLSVHFPTSAPVEHDDMFRSPMLLVELKNLTVGNGDRGWTQGHPTHVHGILKGIEQDLARAAHTRNVPLVVAVFLEPLAFDLEADERRRRQALISTLFASTSYSYVPTARADGFQCCVALLTSTSIQEVL